MARLLKFEFRKLTRMKSFYICLLISLAFSALMVVSQVFLSDATGAADNSKLAFASLAAAPNNGQLVILLAVFVSLFICSDYTEGTIKNIISRGYSRSQVYVAQYVTMIVTGLIFAILNMVFGFVLTAAFLGLGKPIEHMIPIVLIDLLLVIGCVSLYHFFAVLFRRNGGSIAMGILFPICIGIVISILTLLVKREDLNLGVLELSNCMSILAGAAVTTKEIVLVALSGLVYSVLFGVAGFFTIRRRELS